MDPASKVEHPKDLRRPPFLKDLFQEIKGPVIKTAKCLLAKVNNLFRSQRSQIHNGVSPKIILGPLLGTDPALGLRKLSEFRLGIRDSAITLHVVKPQIQHKLYGLLGSFPSFTRKTKNKVPHRLDSGLLTKPNRPSDFFKGLFLFGVIKDC